MIYISGDHGSIELKTAIVKMLESEGEKVADLGTNSTESVDYPDYAFAVAEKVAKEGARGIVICKSGIGMCISANKVKGIRCALCTSPVMGELCRRHNNANMLALGAGNTDIPTALEIVKKFLSTEFDGGRHVGRVGKITAYEDKHA